MQDENENMRAAWRSIRAASAFVISVYAIVLTFALCGAGCARQDGEPKDFTGATVTAAQIRAQLPAAYCGKAQYAVANRDWLTWYAVPFAGELSSGPYGIVGWKDHFECTCFAGSFVDYAQRAYFHQAFTSFAVAADNALAIGQFRYTPTANVARGDLTRHAIVVAYTQLGVEFFEPQTGRFVTLDARERASGIFADFD